MVIDAFAPFFCVSYQFVGIGKPLVGKPGCHAPPFNRVLLIQKGGISYMGYRKDILQGLTGFFRGSGIPLIDEFGRSGFSRAEDANPGEFVGKYFVRGILEVV